MQKTSLSEITLLVCAYNAKSYIERFAEAINPLLNKLQILIIDDYSIDDTFELLEQRFKDYPSIKIKKNQDKKGFANALNYGLKNISTLYILRLDIDDHMLPSRPEILLDTLCSKGLDFCGSGYQTVNENDEKTGIRYFPTHHSEIVKRFTNGYFGMGGALILGKTSSFKTLMFDESMMPGEEFDFFVRAIASGFKLGNVHSILYDYYIHSQSLSNNLDGITKKVKQYQNSLKNHHIGLGKIRFEILKEYYLQKGQGKTSFFKKFLFVLLQYVPRIKKQITRIN